MTDRFLKVYTWVLIVFALINIIGGVWEITMPSLLVRSSIIIISVLELFLIPFSLVVILYVFLEKLSPIYFILPILYVIFFIGLLTIGIVLHSQGVDPFDLTSTLALVGFIISVMWYIFHIAWGGYLFKRKII